MWEDVNDYDIKVCNKALMQMGGKKITSLAKPTMVEERDCAEIYTGLRNEVLTAYPWKFARKRKALVKSSTTPAFGFANAFVLPSDCALPLSIHHQYSTSALNAYPQDLEPVWTVEGDLLLTDETAVNLHYTAYPYDASKYSVAFVKALALLLASYLAMSVGKNPTLATSLRSEYYDYIEQDAMIVDGGIGNLQHPEINTYTDER